MAEYDQSAYDPNAPAVVEFVADVHRRLTLSTANLLFNWPWAQAGDSGLVLSLKARWRVLRILPEEPFQRSQI